MEIVQGDTSGIDRLIVISLRFKASYWIVWLPQISHYDAPFPVDGCEQEAILLHTHICRYDLLLVVVEDLGWLVRVTSLDVSIAEVPDLDSLIS